MKDGIDRDCDINIFEEEQEFAVKNLLKGKENFFRFNLLVHSLRLRMQELIK